MTDFLQHMIDSKINAIGLIRPRPRSVYEAAVRHYPHVQGNGSRLDVRSIHGEYDPRQGPQGQPGYSDELSPAGTSTDTGPVFGKMHHQVGQPQPIPPKSVLGRRNTGNRISIPDTTMPEPRQVMREYPDDDPDEHNRSSPRQHGTILPQESPWEPISVPKKIPTGAAGTNTAIPLRSSPGDLQGTYGNPVHTLTGNLPASPGDLQGAYGNPVHTLTGNLPASPGDLQGAYGNPDLPLSGNLQKKEGGGSRIAGVRVLDKGITYPVLTGHSTVPDTIPGILGSGPRSSARELPPYRMVYPGDTSMVLHPVRSELRFKNFHEEPPVIRVSIGRIEVRVVSQEPVSQPTAARKPVPHLSLDEYLRARGSGRS
jgi:hypothetical protein